MKQHRPARSILRPTILLISLGLSGLCHAFTPVTLKDLSPEKGQPETARVVAKRLGQLHYNHREFNDELSSVVFDRFLTDLDPAHSYFLASDIEEFEHYRTTIDDAFWDGDLKPAFEIFNRYQQRLANRLNFTQKMLEDDLDGWTYATDETLEIERKNSPWPRNQAEWDDIWRKRQINNALNLKLTGKDKAEIRKTLIRRNKNQITRALQVNSEDAFQIYLNALTQSYDPHTNYLSPSVSDNFNINMSLQVSGIGAVLQAEDEYTKIQSLVTGGPAERSGLLHPSDKVVAVAQENEEPVDVIGWRLDEVVKLIRGNKGTRVTLDIIPANAHNEHETKRITLVRDAVKLEDRAATSLIIDAQVNGKHHKVGVIYVPTFYADFQCLQNDGDNCTSTTRDVERLIENLKAQRVESLVIDLRNNGGGALQEANAAVGLFIPRGPTVQIRNSNGKVDTMISPFPEPVYTGPMAVLVNRLSASASEIFAGAIQDYRRGLIIGERTFGKGTVQTMQNLESGQLKITMGKFYRISGESNQHTGIHPDIALPSLLDHVEQGESALPNALPSDRIKPANFQTVMPLDLYLPGLRSADASRLATNPDFVFLNGQISLQDELRSKTVVSINEKVRLKEQEQIDQRRLALENAKRKAKSQLQFKSVDEMRKKTDEEESKALADQGHYKEDYVLSEVGKIMADFATAIQQPERMASH